jgi:hypothetical protein
VRFVRRVALIGVVVLCCCSPAQAGLLAHPGQPVLPGTRSLQGLQAYPRTLVELDRVRGGAAVPALRRAGGELIVPPLALWRLPSWTAERLLPGLERRGLIQSVTPDVPIGTDPRSAGGFLGMFTDPLASSEWWARDVGVQNWVAPGPGKPLTMVDSGVDLTHEEFAGRPNTIALNTQTYNAFECELHGTATASVAAAPVNAKGLVGLYPQAKLQLWDASPVPTSDCDIAVGDELRGLYAAARKGPGVVNLSLGGSGRFSIEERAVMALVGEGSLVVAAAGNDREYGSALSYPASFAHVLTVGATNQADHVTSFSSASPFMDLAAPGQDIPAAIPKIWDPTGTGYASVDGTSFSTPLVSAAAAAVWTLRPKLTNTQLFEIMRRSARDVGKRGWDADTGYGILNVPAALRRKAPPPDPGEPNDDIYLVKPDGLTRAGQPPLTSKQHPTTTISAQVERREDPEDVYRVFLPAKGRVRVTVRPTANVNLEVWGRRTRTVFERGAAARRDLLGLSAHAGNHFERVTIQGRRSPQFVYVDVVPNKKVVRASYTLRVAPVR